jgi:hypothetical protein
MTNKTNVIGIFAAALAMGCVLGAYLEYIMISAKNTRQLLKAQQEVRDVFDMTDAELVKNAKKVPQFFEDEKQQERMAAASALGAYRLLEMGKVDDAKFMLLVPIRVYYQLYHEKGGDPQVIGAIEEAAKESPELAAEIAKK